MVYYRPAIVDCFRFNLIVSKYSKFRHFLFLFVEVLVSDGKFETKKSMSLESSFPGINPFVTLIVIRNDKNLTSVKVHCCPTNQLSIILPSDTKMLS